MQNLIDIDGLAVRIAGAPILHDVRLHLAPGEIYGLLGPNGAGKSTTIAALLGRLPAERGSISVLGHDPAMAPASLHARIGVVPENEEFYDWMTAAQYLGFFARLRGERPDEATLAAWLSTVGLASRQGQRIGTFSHGMHRRLSLARALLGQPELLVLDEPTKGLNPYDRRDIHDFLLWLSAERGVGILLCTHLLDDIERLCDRIGILLAGRTEGEGMISQIGLSAAHRIHLRMRLHEMSDLVPQSCPTPGVLVREDVGYVVELASTVTPDEAWCALLFGGYPVVEIRPESSNLENLFLRREHSQTASLWKLELPRRAMA